MSPIISVQISPRSRGIVAVATQLAAAAFIAAACSNATAAIESAPQASTNRVQSPVLAWTNDPGEMLASAAYERSLAVGAAGEPTTTVDEAAPEAPLPNAEQPPVWIATHSVTTLWDGPNEDSRSLGRLPPGSYFPVSGDAIQERLPVQFSGNASTPAGPGWVDTSAIGPIPTPPAGWSQPNWPARRLVTGQRDELVRGDPSLPLIALTFDAGAGSGSVSNLLDVLADRRVKATFFVAGAFADRYPDVLARIAGEGHELANHSYSHPDFRNLSEAQMRVELRRGTTSIEAASGARVAPFWRPPFGSRDDRILRIVAEEGFRSIFWTFDSGDWLETATTERVRDAVLRQAVSGAVVVHHVSPAATAAAMPTIIDELRRRGFDLVTVGELIGP